MPDSTGADDAAAAPTIEKSRFDGLMSAHQTALAKVAALEAAAGAQTAATEANARLETELAALREQVASQSQEPEADEAAGALADDGGEDEDDPSAAWPGEDSEPPTPRGNAGIRTDRFRQATAVPKTPADISAALTGDARRNDAWPS